jgi:hypothetical protein
MLTATQPYQEYLKALKQNLAHGDSTEHTHRASLHKLNLKRPWLI